MMTESVRQNKIVKGGKLQKSESSLICVVIAEGSANALPVFISILAHFLHSSLLTLQECPSSMSDQWHSAAGHRIFRFCCHHFLSLEHTPVLL